MKLESVKMLSDAELEVAVKWTFVGSVFSRLLSTYDDKREGLEEMFCSSLDMFVSAANALEMYGDSNPERAFIEEVVPDEYWTDFFEELGIEEEG